MGEDNKQNRLDTISPTALAGLSSYAICGIPLAKEFLDLICKDGIANPPISIFNPSGDMPAEDLIRREVHSRAMDAILRSLLDEGRADTILEFASGMSPRGLGLVNDHEVTYIETDISNDFAQKRSLCGRVAEGQGMELKGRHLFYPVDAITMDGMDEVRKQLEPGKPIIITHAGLITYHPPEKRDQISYNFREIMRSAPGSLWVTPDPGFLNTAYLNATTRLSGTYAQHLSKVTADFKQKLGVDVDRDFYADEGQIEEHYNRLGFKIQKFGQPEFGFAIQSAPLLQLDDPAREEFLILVKNSIKAWVFQLADNYQPVQIAKPLM